MRLVISSNITKLACLLWHVWKIRVSLSYICCPFSWKYESFYFYAKITREMNHLLKLLGYKCNPLDNKNTVRIDQILENLSFGFHVISWSCVTRLAFSWTLSMSACRCFSAIITHQSTTDARLNSMPLPKTDFFCVGLIVRW